MGLGRAGWNIHAARLRENPAFTITEVADPDEHRRNEASEAVGCRTFANLDELLEGGKAEVIVIATPNPSHEADAIRVLEAGRHCVLEKPAALEWAGVQRVIQSAGLSPGHLFVHHQHLFLEDFLFIQSLIASGTIGEVFEIRLNWASYARRNDWQTLRKNGGGLLNNHGPHALSVILALLESRVSNVSSFLRQVKDTGDCEDHVHLLLQAENGRVADVFLTSSCAVPLPRFVVLGSAGSAISVDDKVAKVRFYDPSQVPLLKPKDGMAANRKYGTGEQLPWQEEDRPLVSGGGTTGFYENVAGVLRGEQSPVVTPESVLEVARVLDWAASGQDPALEQTP